MLKETKLTRGIRKHNNYRVTVTYRDNEASGRVYNNREKAEQFAAPTEAVAICEEHEGRADRLDGRR